MNIARLNDSGIAIFAGWLETLKQGGSVQAPVSLLTDPEKVEQIEVAIEVDERVLHTRFEAAEYLFNLFANAGLTDIDADRGMWAWLSLFYFDSVCPIGKGGLRKPGAQPRHIPEPGNFQRYYRHLLAGPYGIYRAHRDDPKRAMALLCQPLSTPGEIVEQIASRQELITNRGVVALATRLYFDPIKNAKKTGVEGKGSGTPRRLSDVLDQFDLTWDLYASTGDELATVMPKEFARFLVPG